MTQRELAELAGVSLRTLRQIEHGHVARPRTASVRQLVGILGSDPAPEQPVSGQVRIDVLGQLVVHRGVEVVSLVSVQQRCVLGLLALHPNQVVATAEMVEVLWGDRPPATYRELLHTVVSRLRKVLRSSDEPIITTQGTGYLLEIDPQRLDLLRFAELAARARETRDTAAALDTFERALGCWLGQVLTDLPERLRLHPTAIAVAQRRLSTVLAYADLAVEHGRHEQAATQLRALSEGEPLHEGLHARLMLALAGSGQQAAALALFAQIRDRLADELGVTPGAELREAHLRVVRGEVRAGVSTRVPAHPVPAELPADVAGFSGRTAELSRLSTLLTELRVAERDGQVPPVVIAAIHGAAGVGKTAFAVQWAHRVRGEFPDGQLFVNLRGFDSAQPPTQSCAVIGRFLRALGVDPIPHDVEERVARYRSALADRRVLIVLDNAASAEQVRPLLPGTSTCLVLVTSRNRLGGLVAVDGAVHLPLETLSPSEAMSLLENLVGRQRVKAEATHAAELARLCGYLPLALRLAARELRLRPRCPIAGAVAALSGQARLAALEIPGDPGIGVRAALDLSYLALPPEQQRLFRRLGLIPGPDFTPRAATCLLDGPSEEHLTESLDRLVDANLAERHQHGRYRLHDLVRLYAQERCRTDESSATDDLLARLLQWYLTTTRAAGRPLYGQFQYLADHQETASDTFADNAAALAWLDAENVNVTAAVHDAAGHADPRSAWLLADAMSGYFMIRADNHTEWLTSVHTGLRAATRAGDERAQAAMQLSVGVAHWCTSAPRGLLDHSARALELARQARWPVGEAVALTHLGQAHVALGGAHEALEFVEQALPMCRELPSAMGTAHNLIVRGCANGQLGELEQAVDALTAAVVLGQEQGMLMVVCVAQHGLGETCRMLGRWSEARECHAASLAAARAHGMRYREAHNRAAIAEVACRTGEHDEAKVLIQEAVSVARKARDRAGEANVLAIAGRISTELGDSSLAVEQHREARDIAHEAGLRHLEAQALLGLATARSAAGAHLEAMSYAREALTHTEPAGYQVLTGQAMTVLAESERLMA